MRIIAAFLTAFFAMTTLASATSLHDVFKGSMKLFAKSNGICSVTLIDDNFLLGVNHCTNGKNFNVRIEVRDENFVLLREQIIYVKPVRTFKGTDLALFAPVDPLNNFKDILGENVSVVQVATPDEVNTLLRGDTIWAVGYPMAKELTVTMGVYNGLVPTPSKEYWDTNLYSFTAPITGGNSGGGLYAKFGNEYKLIGVNVGMWRNVDFLNMAVPIDKIQDILNNFVEKKIVEEIVEEGPKAIGPLDDR